MKSLDLSRRGDLETFLDPVVVDLSATVSSTYGLETFVIRWSERLWVVIEGSVGWVFGPAETDPTGTGDGRSVIPARQRRQLVALTRSGMSVQRLALAHQIATMPDTYDEPRPCTLEEAHRLVGPVPAHPRLVRTVTALNALTGETSSASASTRALDHIVFGVLAPTHPTEGQPAVWAVLVTWRW